MMSCHHGYTLISIEYCYSKCCSTVSNSLPPQFSHMSNSKSRKRTHRELLALDIDNESVDPSDDEEKVVLISDYESDCSDDSVATDDNKSDSEDDTKDNGYDSDEGKIEPMNIINNIGDHITDWFFAEGFKQEDMDKLSERKQEALYEEAEKTDYAEEYVCKCGEHKWHRLEDRERWAFENKLFTHTEEKDSHVYTKSKAERQDRRQNPPPYYPTLVERVCTDEVFMEIIKGTNEHGRHDDKFTKIPENEEGIHIIKMYFVFLIKNGMRNSGRKGLLQDMWNTNTTIGCAELNIYLSYRRWTSINKHICFNRYRNTHG